MKNIEPIVNAPLGPKAINLVGKRFGRLTVLAFHHRSADGRLCWECRCECGGSSVANSSHLHSGDTKSCGCYNKETASLINFKHGMTQTRTWSRWSSMLERGAGKSCPTHYADRGIKVCDRWRVFENFLADMGECPEGLSLDRIENDGDYEPGNCRWATAKTQVRNRRITLRHEYMGEIRSLAEIAEMIGIRYRTLWMRLNRGWSFEKAVTERECVDAAVLMAKAGKGVARV